MTKFHKVAYIMSRFPGLSETFILREMCELERIGWHLSLYPLIFKEETVIHEEAKSWMGRAENPLFYEILKENIKLMFSRPWLYFSIMFRVIINNLKSPKFLSRAIIVFPKAVWMSKKMVEENIEHIHSHYATHPALAAWIINQITGIPYGITVHAHDIFVDRSMLHQKLLDAAYIVAISEYNRNFLADHYGEWINQKTHIIHCGIYLENYKNEYVPFVKTGKFEIISIGSLRPYKGFVFLLHACYMLKQEIGANFRCRIIGGGELQSSLVREIERLNINDVVDLVGPKNQTEVAKLLKEAHCYVQPSIITNNGKMEGIPVSLMEAMASGLPVVATEISGIPELVIDGETGILVPFGDPKSLFFATLRIYNDPQISSILSGRGRKMVLSEFDIINTVYKLSGLFESFFEEKSWK